MPNIRNLALIKRFTDYFRLKANDMLDSNAGRMLVPVVSIPVPPNIIELIDVALNDSNKNFVVPSGKQWKLLYGSFTLITSANAGNRQMRISFFDGANNVFYRSTAANVQTASVTENYAAGQFGDSAETTTQQHTLPIPVNSILPGGFQINIADSFGIDAAGDDLSIRLIAEETDLTSE